MSTASSPPSDTPLLSAEEILVQIREKAVKLPGIDQELVRLVFAALGSTAPASDAVEKVCAAISDLATERSEPSAG